MPHMLPVTVTVSQEQVRSASVCISSFLSLYTRSWQSLNLQQCLCWEYCG